MWAGRTFNEGLMSSFYRFLARFSGRRRGILMSIGRMRTTLLPIFSLLALNTLLPFAEGCSSRSTPKPRPTLVGSTSRPNVTFHTYPCPSNYAAFYCLNGATCFTLKIGESVLYNCECADGYMGQRCEFKDLDGSYMQANQRVLLETASIASGATIAVILVVIICMIAYIHYQRRHKYNSTKSDEGDGVGDPEKRAPFSRRDPTRLPLRQYPLEARCPNPMGDNLTASIYATNVLVPGAIEPP